jgi:hypothetical protein
MKASAAFTAIAASTALPPRLSTSTPIPTASGCAAATMPCFATVAERVANAALGRSAASAATTTRRC